MSPRDAAAAAPEDAKLFADTLSDCLQENLLEAADCGEDAVRNFNAMGAADHLQALTTQLSEAGYRVRLELDEGGCRARLTWRMAGASHPRDRYVLAVVTSAAGATARFVGPARRSAIFLRTRNTSINTLRRWSTTFVEWVLTTHETR